MNLAEQQFGLYGQRLAGFCGKKCGLITVTAFEDEYIFQLNCLFCSNVFSCFENFLSHIKLNHPPLSFKYFKNNTDNDSDREHPDQLVYDSLSISGEFQKEIKVEYEERSNLSLSRKNLCNELQENQVNDDAEFISEDCEQSMDTLSSVGPCKIAKLYFSKTNKGDPLNREEVSEKTEKIAPPAQNSSRFHPVQESPQANLTKDSNFHHPKNKIKLEYEETANFTESIKQNQSNDDAEFMSEDEHCVCGVQKSSYATCNLCNPKDYSSYRVWSIGDHKHRKLVLDIIKMWKSNPCLWDQKCADYKQKKRIETWDTMRISLKQNWNCEISRDTLLDKTRTLRKQYDQVVRNSTKAKTSKDVRLPWFFKNLSFLAPHTFYCDECDRVFHSEDCFNYHKCTYGGRGSYVCNACNKEFPSIGELKMHFRRCKSTIDYLFECKVCGRKFSVEYQLITHLRRHTYKENSFACS